MAGIVGSSKCQNAGESEERSGLAVASRADVPAVEVELECSDKQEHRRRVEQRLGLAPALSGPTWEEVVSRDYRAWDRDHIVIDTANQPADQIAARLP